MAGPPRGSCPRNGRLVRPFAFPEPRAARRAPGTPRALRGRVRHATGHRTCARSEACYAPTADERRGRLRRADRGLRARSERRRRGRGRRRAGMTRSWRPSRAPRSDVRAGARAPSPAPSRDATPAARRVRGRSPTRAATRAIVAASRFTRSSRTQRARVGLAAACPRAAVEAGPTRRCGAVERPSRSRAGRLGRVGVVAIRSRARRVGGRGWRRARATIRRSVENPLFSAFACVRRELLERPRARCAPARAPTIGAARVRRRRVRANVSTPPLAPPRRSRSASAAAEKVRALSRKSACAARNPAPFGGAADGREWALGTRSNALRRDARDATRARDKKISMRWKPRQI